jgi:MFS family permease
MAELHRLHGWSSFLIGSAITAYYLLGAIFLAQVHIALRRLGPAGLLAAGILLLGLGAAWFSLVREPWQLFAASVLMAAGWAGCTSTAISTVLAAYFERQRGLAITLALNGASAAGFTVGPLLVVLSQHIGLGNAVPLTALALAAIVLPLVGFGLRKPPTSASPLAASESSRFTAASILRTSHFWSVSLPFALALAAQVGLIIQLVSFLLPHLGPKGAATGLAMTSLAALSGRLALASVVDRLPHRPASALMLLFSDQPAALYAGCLVFGFSVGNVITFPALIVQREFPAGAFGPVIGLSTAVGQFAFALAPALLGMIRDLMGSYASVLLACIALQLCGSILILARARREPGAPARHENGRRLTEAAKLSRSSG